MRRISLSQSSRRRTIASTLASKLRKAERPLKAIVRAKIAAWFQARCAARRKHEDRRPPLPPDLPEEGSALGSGSSKVENDQVVDGQFRALQRIGEVSRVVHQRAVRTEADD